MTRDRLDILLDAIAAHVGIEVRDAQLVKFTNNAVFRLPHAPVVVRVAGSATTRARVTKVVKVATWLAEMKLPAVRLLPGLRQPLSIDGELVTLWEAVSESSSAPRPTGTDLASILRRFHALPTPAFHLAAWRPLDEIRQRLAEPEGLEPHELEFLLERCDEIEAQLAQVEYVLPAGPIHGDAFLGNLISGPAGIVICDFDSTSIGPREWDLTPVAVGELRFNYPGTTRAELVEHYGFDVTAWSGFHVLRRVRELKLVTSVVPILRSNPGIRTQWRHRFDTFRRGDTTTHWSPYR